MESLACTFTLKPVHYRHQLSKQYDLIKNELINTSFNFSLVTEITNSGNVHLHGIIDQKYNIPFGSFKQHVIEYFRTSKVIGFICLKELTDVDKWVGYCLKNYYITKKDLYFAPTVMMNNSIHFPKGIDLLTILRDMLEENIDESIFVNINDVIN